MSAVVIGVGNPFRRDDGFGPAVVDELAGRVPSGVRLLENAGDTPGLIEAWDGADLAIAVDAVHTHTDPIPGRVHRVGADAIELGRSASTHGLGLGEAADLAAALGRLPGRLVVYAVEGADFAFGTGLSEPVRRAVPGVVEAILRELDAE